MLELPRRLGSEPKPVTCGLGTLPMKYLLVLRNKLADPRNGNSQSEQVPETDVGGHVETLDFLTSIDGFEKVV